MLLRLAGEQQVREVRYSDVSGEPGATYYGYVRENKRYLTIEPLVTPPVMEHDDDNDSGLGEEHPRGIDEVDGRQARLSQNAEEPRAAVVQAGPTLVDNPELDVGEEAVVEELMNLSDFILDY